VQRIRLPADAAGTRAMDTTDRAIAVVRERPFRRQHPTGVRAVAVTGCTAPRVVWRWLQRGFLVWRSWVRCAAGYQAGSIERSFRLCSYGYLRLRSKQR